MKKYFVVGNPINHSFSPKLHNYWLKQNNINAVYEKIKLEENEIKNFISKIKNQEINGCNVTVPFKKTVIPFLDKLSFEAEQTQSVNTIFFVIFICLFFNIPCSFPWAFVIKISIVLL